MIVFPNFYQDTLVFSSPLGHPLSLFCRKIALECIKCLDFDQFFILRVNRMKMRRRMIIEIQIYLDPVKGEISRHLSFLVT